MSAPSPEDRGRPHRRLLARRKLPVHRPNLSAR